MGVVYKVVLELGKSTKDGKLIVPSLEQILEIAHGWIETKTKGIVPIDDLFHERHSIRLDAGISIDTYFDQEGKEQYFGFELRHPDSTRPIDEWLTIFATRVAPDRAIAQVTLVKEDFGGIEKTEAVHSNISRPNLVPMLIKGVGAQEPSLSVLVYPLKIPLSQAQLFANFINDSRRKLPVIYASRTNREGRLLLDPYKTADRVCGIAHVLFPENLHTSNEIERFMTTRDKKCYDGAVRIYWPSVAGQMFNKYFTQEELGRRGVFKGYDFPTRVLSLISDFLVKSPDAVTIADIKQVAARKEQRRLAELQDYQALAQSYADESTELRQTVLKLEALNSTLDQRCKILQESLNDRIVQVTERPSGSLVIENVYDAVQVAQKMFSDRIIFLSRAINDARKSEYDNPSAVFDAFRVIATTYFDARKGIANVRDMNHLFMECCGFKYSGGQSETTMKAYRDEYFANLEDGRKISLEEHLKGGIGRDPRNNIRIAFHYDPQTKKVYIGYIGTHQTNTRS